MSEDETGRHSLSPSGGGRFDGLAHLPILFMASYLVVDTAQLRLEGLRNLRPLLVFIVILPVLDVLLGRNTRNRPVRSGLIRTVGDGWHRLLLYLWVLLVGDSMIWAFRVAGDDPDRLRLFGAVILLGSINAIGAMVVGHELMHGTSRFDRGCAEVLLAAVSYGHFCVEHVQGHHSRVATIEDPATARRGESLYAFVPRSVVGGLRSAIRLQTRRLERRGLALLSLSNHFVRFAAMWSLFVVVSILIGGSRGLVVFVGQSLIAITFLEAVNYIEHYGLVRSRVYDRYERIGPNHSWEANQRLTNWALFNLGRHADHHRHAARRYQDLRVSPSSPQLPTGYFGSLLLAAVPWLWFRVMHPRLDRVADGAAA